MPENEDGQNDRHNIVVLRDTSDQSAGKRLSHFIANNTAAIVTEWEAFRPNADAVS